MIDPTALVVWNAASQKPFGLASVDEDPDGDSNDFKLNIRLPGQYYDAETGHHYNYFRDYYPGVGRYLQADPIGLKGGINLYGYVYNNPLNWIDFWGLDETSWSNWGWGANDRSLFNGLTNGNWGGECWGGGRNSCGPEGPGNMPPTDSADECYKRHDDCYDSGADKKECDKQLVEELEQLPNDPREWPNPPKPGTENDSKWFRLGAIWYFR